MGIKETAMSDRQPDRLKFIGLEFENTSEGRQAKVTLGMQPDLTFVGTANCSEAAGGELRCAALAAVDAIHRAASETERIFKLEGARVVKAFDATVVIVSLKARLGGGKRRLVGSYLVEDDEAQGAALAVLNATNRLLGVTMFSE